jgi:hypothetical protein
MAANSAATIGVEGRGEAPTYMSSDIYTTQCRETLWMFIQHPQCPVLCCISIP